MRTQLTVELPDWSNDLQIPHGPSDEILKDRDIDIKFPNIRDVPTIPFTKLKKFNPGLKNGFWCSQVKKNIFLTQALV